MIQAISFAIDWCTIDWIFRTEFVIVIDQVAPKCKPMLIFTFYARFALNLEVNRTCQINWTIVEEFKGNLVFQPVQCSVFWY